MDLRVAVHDGHEVPRVPRDEDEEFGPPIGLAEAEEPTEEREETESAIEPVWPWSDADDDEPEPAEDPVDEILESSEGLYMREIRRYPLLTAKDEVRLALTREAGETAAAELETLPANHVRRAELEAIRQAGDAARRRLVESNLRLVVTVARKYGSMGMPLLDLIQEGNIGLERAVVKYDPRTGYRFSTYAYWWIRQAVSRALADQARVIRLPVHVVERLGAISRARRELEQQSGNPPRPEQIAAKLNLPVTHVREALRASRSTLSLERPLGTSAEDDLTLADVLADHDAPAPESTAARTVLVDELERVLEALTPREQVVLKLRFGLGHAKDGYNTAYTLAEIGDELGMSRERVRQIEAEALAKLRASGAMRQLKEYLD